MSHIVLIVYQCFVECNVSWHAVTADPRTTTTTTTTITTISTTSIIYYYYGTTTTITTTMYYYNYYHVLLQLLLCTIVSRSRACDTCPVVRIFRTMVFLDLPYM